MEYWKKLVTFIVSSLVQGHQLRKYSKMYRNNKTKEMKKRKNMQDKKLCSTHIAKSHNCFLKLCYETCVPQVKNPDEAILDTV